MSVAASSRSELTLPSPSVTDEALFAADVAILGEADMIRARRTLDDIEARLAAVEATFPVRVERGLRSLAGRLRNRARSEQVDR
jgi:hypothetical protein